MDRQNNNEFNHTDKTNTVLKPDDHTDGCINPNIAVVVLILHLKNSVQRMSNQIDGIPLLVIFRSNSSIKYRNTPKEIRDYYVSYICVIYMYTTTY